MNFYFSYALILVTLKKQPNPVFLCNRELQWHIFI
uniref:Uncharacterized protein n=1 Tax=Anguilla anguilla TaxID=7936 RepID=A0A0E9XTF8_ANGAN